MFLDSRQVAPIVLFAFNRPDHLRETLSALSNNILVEKSDLTIYCDGPRNEHDVPLVNAVLSIANRVTCFHSCTVVSRVNNFGLARNIIDGVSEQLAIHDRIIVLEDDLITSPFFLKYMNDALELYQCEVSVASIHGYSFPCKKRSEKSTFFLRGADCWGWGTWQRAWKYFNQDARCLYNCIIENNDYYNFNRRLSYPYMEMLKDVYQGKSGSWAVRWLGSAWVNNMYTLYPRDSLVRNIGMDGSGVHCAASNTADVSLSKYPIAVEKISVEENKDMSHELIRFLERDSGGKLERAKRMVKYFFPYLFKILTYLKNMLKNVHS